MFWERPYRQKLVRWGTALHDRFMLPHYLWSDFADVVADLKAADLAVDLEWFRPHFEFRFPLLRNGRSVELEARVAPGARAVARPRRGERRRRHGALRRFLARARRGQGQRPDRRSLRRDLQRPPAAAGSDGKLGRSRRRRALSRLVAALGAASDDTARTCR